MQSLSDKHSLSDTSQNQRRSEGFSDPESCIEALKSNIKMSHPQVLFLRGHPSPNWLSSLGAFCYVDPELFRGFLRYRAEPGSDYYFESAPSIMSNIFRFKFSTIGYKNRRYRSSQEEIDALREKASNDLNKYRAELRGNWALKTGGSIVRDFHVIDERYCVIEQEIVISIFDVGKTWMGKNSFTTNMDTFADDYSYCLHRFGANIADGPQFPWLRSDTQLLPITLLPIVQYKPRCELKSRSIGDRAPMPVKERNAQSLAIFPEGYRRGLDWSLAKS